MIENMHTEPALGDLNRDYSEKYTESTVRGDNDHDEPIPGKKLKKEFSFSSSTSSDDSSEEDFFQLDATELNKAVAANSEFLSDQHGGSAQLASESGIHNGEAISINLSSKHGALSEKEGIAASQSPVGRPFSPDVSGGSPGSDINMLETRQSPPVQAMTRSDVPDPNRIPSSIFERSKSTTPVEWSVASNESLFSIHMGNSSFSRDAAILMGRSGELGSTPPISPLSSPSPANLHVEHELSQPGTAEVAMANAEAMKDLMRAAADEHTDKNKPPAKEPVLSGSISHQSDGSTNSFSSFAFPILEGRSGSVKVEPEPQRSETPQKPSTQTETPKAAPSASENKWFSCFSCCPFCS